MPVIILYPISTNIDSLNQSTHTLQSSALRIFETFHAFIIHEDYSTIEGVANDLRVSHVYTWSQTDL